MKINGFDAFLESRAYTAFDIAAAEAYFSQMTDVPDSVPTNVREWTTVANQMQRFADLLGVARGNGDKSALAKLTTDSSIRKAVLGKDPYKKSMFEISEDIMSQLGAVSKYGNKKLSVMAEELEHCGFPPRVKQHMGTIRQAAFDAKMNTSGASNVFAYDKRGMTILSLIPDVAAAKENGVDVTDITVDIRTNIGGPMEYKGGIRSDLARHRSEYYYADVFGDGGWMSTVYLDIKTCRKLHDLGVRSLTCLSKGHPCGCALDRTDIEFQHGMSREESHVPNYIDIMIKARFVVAYGYFRNVDPPNFTQI